MPSIFSISVVKETRFLGNPPFLPFHHNIAANFLLYGNQGSIKKGDWMQSGRSHSSGLLAQQV